MTQFYHQIMLFQTSKYIFKVLSSVITKQMNMNNYSITVSCIFCNTYSDSQVIIITVYLKYH